MAGRLRIFIVGTAMAAALIAPSAANALTSSPASSWQTNGRVRAIVVAGGKIFIGGDFTRVRAPGASGGGAVRNHLAALSLKTGKLMPWHPNANGTVTALRANARATTVYIGGGFTRINGRMRTHLAAVTASGSTLRKWHANTNGTVYAITVGKSRIYIGGSFTRVKGLKRNRLAAVGQNSTARMAPWHPNANSTVRALTMSPSGKRVFAGGAFSRVNGRLRPHLAALWTTGGLSRFAAHPVWPVNSLRTAGKQLIAGGGGNGGHVALYSSANGVRRWLAVTDGDVQGVAVSGSLIIVGGHFNNFCVGREGHGDPLVCNNPLARRKLMALGFGEGTPTGWDPDVVGSPIGVSAVAGGGGGAQAGGAFSKVHGVNQQGFARFR
jgi:hypothetical protein